LTFDASGTGGLTFSDGVASSTIRASGGNVRVRGTVSDDPIDIFSGHQVEVAGFDDGSSFSLVTFANNAGFSGRLVVDTATAGPGSKGFTEGLMQQFFGSDPSHSDVIDLRDVDPASASWSYSPTNGGSSGLTVDSNSGEAIINLLGQYLAGGASASSSGPDSNLFHLASDGHGGTLLTTSFHA
jgi:hypothetical protein